MFLFVQIRADAYGSWLNGFYKIRLQTLPSRSDNPFLFVSFVQIRADAYGSWLNGFFKIRLESLPSRSDNWASNGSLRRGISGYTAFIVVESLHTREMIYEQLSI